MKRFSMILVSVLVFGLSISVTAGEGHAKKCKGSAQKCLDKQMASFAGVAWDGINVEMGEDKPMVVTEVAAQSPGAEAGIQAGDVLVSLNGKKLAGMNNKNLMATMSEFKIGEVATYIVKRGHNKQSVNVTMSELPTARAAKYVGQHMSNGHAKTAASCSSAKAAANKGASCSSKKVASN